MFQIAEKYGASYRLKILAIIFIGVAFFIIGRLYSLQVKNHYYYKHLADKRSVRVVSEIALRGLITDREGEPLAVSSPVSSIVADPKLVEEEFLNHFERLKKSCEDEENPEPNKCKLLQNYDEATAFTMYKQERLAPLAALLKVETEDLMADLEQRKNSRFYYLKRQVQPEVTEKIMALDIGGIFRNDGFSRFYPDGELLAQVLGFTNIDEEGQEGIEKQYDEWLRGQKGKLKVTTAAGNRRKPLSMMVEEVPTVQGQDLQLSIDKRIQYIMRRELASTKAEFKAKSVSAVMIDIATGEILAMVSLPDGNPNISSERKPNLMRNRVITDVFEPGSTMKPIAMAAALDAGVITTRTIFQTHGVMPMGKRTVRDPSNYGTMDSFGVIRKSSNIGMAMISQRMPRARYYAFMKKMGFGEVSSLRFPGESKGVHRNPAKFDDFSYATTFFGYGISASALQVAHAYATIANHGVKVPLTLIKRDMSSEGEQVIKPEVADTVVQMMKTVVQEGGTGTRANTISYTIAGKTGTARKVVGKTYSETLHRGLFAGIAPANNPRISLVVVVDEPQDKTGAGGIVAAPAFSRITENSLKLLGVLPDKINRNNVVHLTVGKTKRETN